MRNHKAFETHIIENDRYLKNQLDLEKSSKKKNQRASIVEGNTNLIRFKERKEAEDETD